MNSLKVGLFLFLLFFFFSCSIKEKTISEFEEKIHSMLEKKRLAELDYVIVLPGEGCMGCISSTEKFVKTVSDSDRILIIFTKIRSKKILKMKLGLDLTRDLFHLDNDGVFNSGRMYSIYPTVFLLDNGKITSFEYISPSSAFQLDDIKLN